MTTRTAEETESRAKRRSQYHEADVVVVGAGVFGCAAAFALANQGRSVILLERWLHEPDRIVGELLQPGGVAALRKLGLGDCLEGIDAIPCYGYHVLYHGDNVVIPYPTVDASGKVQAKTQPTGTGVNGFAGGEKNGMPEGRGFHHGRFIMQLRQACAQHPNITIFETEVTTTVRGEGSSQVLGVETRTTNKETGEKKPDCFFGQLTIIADGYASRFRKEFVGSTPVVRSKFYALELIDCPFPPANFGHVVIGKAFPVLFYQIGTRETRALIDVPERLPEASPANGGVRGYIRNVVLPTLPADVQPCVEAALADGKIPRSMPNSVLHPTPQTANQGVVVLGDAMNMRHPLTGGGMTVAFNDVVVLAEQLDPARVPNLGDLGAVADAINTFYRRRKQLTCIINVLAQALYSLFAARDRQLRALQLGCFGYFKRGFTDEPMGLMGGLIHHPMVLAYHFFSVAFLAIWLNTAAVIGGPLGIWKLPLAIVDSVLILAKACVVFVPVALRELR